jgi:hypothetical protein
MLLCQLDCFSLNHVADRLCCLGMQRVPPAYKLPIAPDLTLVGPRCRSRCRGARMTAAVAARTVTTTAMDVGTAGVGMLVAEADTRTAPSRRAAAARVTAADACSEHDDKHDHCRR